MSKPLHCTATVEYPSGQRSLLTLQISGGDAQGAFDWSCANQPWAEAGKGASTDLWGGHNGH